MEVSALLVDNKYKEITYGNIRKNMYFISPDGKIFSTYLKDFMIPRPDKDGYLEIGIRTNENKQKFFKIHKLVALTFIGEPPSNIKDPTIDHIDSNKLNNHYSNLRWIERGTNSSIRKNTCIGELNHEAKLNEKQVEEICDLLLNTEFTFKQIAEIYNVDKSTINNIKCHKNWKNVTKKYDFSCRKTIREKGVFKCINTNIRETKYA